MDARCVCVPERTFFPSSVRLFYTHDPESIVPSHQASNVSCTTTGESMDVDVGSTPGSGRARSEEMDWYKMRVVHNFQRQIQISTQHGSTPASAGGGASVTMDWSETDGERVLHPPNIQARNETGSTHLHLACQEYFETICTLLDLGADPNARNFEGDTPLHCVAFPQIIGVVQQSRADVNARNGQGETPLHSAVDREDIAVFQALLLAGANPTLRDNKGRSSLDLACLRQNEAMVRILVVTYSVDVTSTNSSGLTSLHLAEGKAVVDMLVDAGASVHARDKASRTPLHFICSKSNFTLCALLNRGADINALDRSLQTPLHRLSKGRDDAGRLVFMLTKGADMHAHTYSGKTPLHLSTQKGRVAMTQILLRSGASLSARSHGGLSALTFVAANNHLYLVEMLIGRVGDVNTVDNIGQTPLHYAVFKGYLVVAAALICAGADPTLRTHMGRSSLDIAVVYGHITIVQIMIEHGVDLIAANNLGQTPLHHACRNNCIAITRVLVEAGADPTLRDIGGMSPLDIASVSGQGCIVETLIESGMDVAAVDRHEWTALHYSAKKGHVAVSQALIAAGADPSARNASQVSPLDIAVGYGYTRLVTKMIESGADVAAVDSSGFTTLHLAEGKNMVDILVGAGADVDAQNDEGNTALMYQSVDDELIGALLSHGAQVNIQNEEGKSVLHMVLESSRGETMVAAVDMLLRAGADETLVDKHGHMPEDYFDDETPFAFKAKRLLWSAPRDRAWRRRSLLLMCMTLGTDSPSHMVTTRSRSKCTCLATWLLDTPRGTEGIFRTMVGYI